MEHLIPETVWQDLLAPNFAVPVERILGGLSGALVFRCKTPEGQACLRGWPPGKPAGESLAEIQHALELAHQAGLTFVPRFLCGADGAKSQRCGSRVWELTEWMPGKADYVQYPSEERLINALAALAELHAVWRSTFTQRATSPACMQRLRMLDGLQGAHLETMWLAACRSDRELKLVRETCECLTEQGRSIQRRLESIANARISLQYAIRDVWSDHVFFEGPNVTGVIDFGALRIDEPATDVARLLGSLEPHSEEHWKIGLDAYRRVNPEVDPRRVQILDQASCLLSAIQWTQWLVVERRRFPVNTDGLHDRWQNFLTRLRDPHWPADGGSAL